MKHILLSEISLTKKEVRDLVDYCSELGYVFDEQPIEFNGLYPVIYKDLSKKRKVYIQRNEEGSLQLIYGSKSEDFYNNYLLMKNFKKTINLFPKLTILYGISLFIPGRLNVSLYND